MCGYFIWISSRFTETHAWLQRRALVSDFTLGHCPQILNTSCVGHPDARRADEGHSPTLLLGTLSGRDTHPYSIPILHAKIMMESLLRSSATTQRGPSMRVGRGYSAYSCWDAIAKWLSTFLRMNKFNDINLLGKDTLSETDTGKVYGEPEACQIVSECGLFLLCYMYHFI